MDGRGWLWVVVGDCEWLWVIVDGCGWLWMIVDGCGRLWMVVDDCRWLSMVVDGCGWWWMVVGGCGWLWLVAYFSIAQIEATIYFFPHRSIIQIKLFFLRKLVTSSILYRTKLTGRRS